MRHNRYSSSPRNRTRSSCQFFSNHNLLLFIFCIGVIAGLKTLFLLSRILTLSPAPSSREDLFRPKKYTRNYKSHTEIEANSTAISVADDTHTIPKILIFTHYRDLLKERGSLTDEEEIVLAANIKKVIDLHNNHNNIRDLSEHNVSETEVRFLTDAECIDSLRRTYPSLIQYFKTESEGMYKADICRGSALYETGGFYLDVDVGVRKNLWKDLNPRTAFVTAKVHAKSNYPGHFFQAILGAAPQSPIIYRYLELFERHYQGKERISKGPLGVILLRRAWDQIYNESNREPTTELYQEVLYHKELFPDLHPRPTWGTRRACHFVVVGTANFKENIEFQWKDRDYHIPFYSRIAGSRMCPIQKKNESAFDS